MTQSIENIQSLFINPLLSWFDTHGRKDLPWQHPRTPYRVWISEIMLQQTQVQTVIPYFLKFIKRFPELYDLAIASEDEVLSYWAGLGYYSRARNIHRTAKIISEEHQGIFPSDISALIKLPGIGRTTAAAIISQAFNQKATIMDGNVKRVLSRYFLLDGWPEQRQVKEKFWRHAEECTPNHRFADYTQAIMDLGATCCTNRKPKCTACPLNSSCQAFISNQTTTYPEKKPKKKPPTKVQHFLIFYNSKNQIYLEKRPPIGIWGGLWSLPTIDENENLELFISKFSSEPHKKDHLLDLDHSFSHFHLKMKIWTVAMSMQPIHFEEESNEHLIANTPPEDITNFNLAANAQVMNTRNSTLFLSEPQAAFGRWYDADEALKLGIASPIKQILNYFSANYQIPSPLNSSS